MSLINEGNQGQGNGGEGGNAGGQQQQQQGGGQTSWRDSLPDELKADVSLQQFNDVASLAKSYISTKAHVGKKGVIVPGQNATDEEWSAFYKSVGQPDLDKFEVKTAEGKKVNAEVISKFKEMAHKAGLLPKQAQSLLDWYVGIEEEMGQNMTKAQQAQQNENIAKLKEKWGLAWGDNLKRAQYAADKLGLLDYLDQSGLGNDTTILQALAEKVAPLFGEDKLRGDGAGKFGKTPAEIQKEITEVQGNKDHPYWNRNHPGHKLAVQEMEGRYKALAGG